MEEAQEAGKQVAPKSPVTGAKSCVHSRPIGALHSPSGSRLFAAERGAGALGGLKAPAAELFIRLVGSGGDKFVHPLPV